MISCSIATNAFKPWDRESWVQPHSPGDTARAFLPSGASESQFVYVNSALRSLDYQILEHDSVAFVSRPEAGTIVGTFLYNLAVGFVAGLVINALFPPPRVSGPQQRDDNSSPTYSFDGIGNNRSEGQPIPIVYGRMRLGGTVIGEYVTATSLFPIRTDLHTLVCFGEGPVHSIGGVEVDNDPSLPLGSLSGDPLPTDIEINDNQAENYDEVHAQVRLGTQQQDVIPSFEDTRQSYSVAQKLTSTSSGTASTSGYAIQRGNGAQYNSTNDPFWDEHGVAFDLNVEDVDEFIVRVQFPSGYYSQNLQNGGLDAAQFGMQARYRQLDSGGTPITTGGPNSDGWIRLPIVDNMPFSKRGSFEWEYRQPFLDKDTYANPTIGKCVNMTGGSALAGTDSVGAPATGYPYASGNAIHEMAFSGWVLLSSGDLPNLDTSFIVFGDTDDAGGIGVNGWSIGANTSENVHVPGLHRWAWTLKIGNGTSFIIENSHPHFAFNNQMEVGVWYHLAFRYKKEATGPGSNSLAQLYVNGQLKIDMTVPFSSRMRAQASPQLDIFPIIGVRRARGLVDNIHVYKQTLPANVISQLYQAGNGTSALIRSEQLVAMYNWDTVGTGYTNNAAPATGGQWYDSMAGTAGSPTVGITDGLISAISSGDFRKGQYRVEVIRANKESPAASVSNQADFDLLTSVITSVLRYPNLALCALRIPATDQLNTSIPKLTFLVKGQLCPVWDGLDEDLPNLTKQWSQNPAWIVLDLLTNKRYGLGQFYEAKDVVLPDLLLWANYCAETVYDGGLQHVMVNTGGDDVLFTEATADVDTGEIRGSLAFTIDPANLPNETLPSTWEVGGRLYVTGFPTSGGFITNDINHDTGVPADFAGYEIYEITHAGGLHLIRVYWDRLDETNPWPDGDFLQADAMAIGDDFGNYTAITSGGQARFTFNGVFDSHRRAWDALLEVCAVGRAMPVREGRRIRFKFNSARSPVGVIGLGSILEGSFNINYGGLAHRSNVVEITFLDEERSFASTTIEARADELNPTNVGNVRKDSQTLFGVTDRHQAERHARFQVLTNELLQRTATWDMGANGLEYEPGDVVRLAHDILPRGVSGRIWSSNLAGVQDRMVIDRDLTIESGTDYNVFIHTSTDEVLSSAIDTSVSTPGDYSAGDEIRLTTNIGHEPQQDEVFIIVKDGSELLMEITNVTLRSDMSKTIDAVEYNELIFADENDSPDGEQESTFGNDPLSDNGVGDLNRTTELSLPSQVERLIISDRFTRTGPGQFLLVVHASWRANHQDRPYIASTEVWMRQREEDATFPVIGDVGTGDGAAPVGDLSRISAPWRRVAVIAGAEEFAEFQIPQSLAGKEIDIAISPIKVSGSKRSPQQSTWQSLTIMGAGPHPIAVSGFAAQLRAQKVVYSWTPTAGEEDALIELRRTSYEDPVVAGWILAPICYRGLPGDADSPPIRDWAGSSVLGKTRILSRMVNPLGHKSDLGAHTFNPLPTLDSFDPSIVDDDVNWSAYSVGGTKWLPGAPAVDLPLVVDLAESGTYPDNILSFTGSSLTGSWTGAHDAFATAGVDQFRRPREYYVEAVLVAEQVHPSTLASIDAIGDLGLERWTLEGPTHLRPGEENCTLLLQARFNIDGTSSGWGNWQNFRPGLYTFVQIHFRMLVTRPTTDYDLKIHKLETRITAPSQGIESRPPYTAALEREFYD